SVPKILMRVGDIQFLDFVFISPKSEKDVQHLLHRELLRKFL
ncbi:9988_t:CDS:1, partial [Cetraspora pellucida]